MDKVECRISVPAVKGLADDQITVGRHLNLNCKSLAATNFNFSKAQFKISEKNPYDFKIFGISQKAEGDFVVDFTLYSAGEHQLSQYVLTDGANEVSINAPAVTVASVLPAQQDGKPPQAFGPLFPIAIAVPLYYYILLLAFIVVAVSLAALRIKRLAYYKKLKIKLKDYSSPSDPDTQFYKTIRQAEKSDYPFAQVEQAFRLYNLRTYQIPMFDLSNEKALKYFKYNDPKSKNIRLNLQKILDEFETLQKSYDSLSAEAKQEFVKKLYRYVDKNKGVRL